MANFKVPRKVQFVTELPLSAVGKVLKRKLREQMVRER
jgi:long-chain acyl-CoA synthetase